jgi:PAS domain S-box-containing protein
MSLILKPVILIIDDSPDIINLISGLLRNHYKVKTATNGDRGLKIAQSDDAIALILLDVLMPGPSGFEVCEQLQSNPKTSDIPVIFLTAMTDIEDEQHGLELGAVDYITKPISPAILLARVKNHLKIKAASDFLKTKNVQAHVRLDLILNATGEGIYGIGINGECIFINTSALTMLGYASQQEVLGKNNHELFHYAHANGSHYNALQCPIYKTLHGDLSSSIDTEVFWRKDGTSFSVQYQARPIIDNEKIIGCVVSFIDITELKKNQATLTMLSTALEQCHSSVMITDLDATIEYVNQAFINSTGYSHKEIIGQKPSLLKSNKTPRNIYDAMWTALLDGKAWQGEVTNLNKQGEEFIELTWISPIRQVDGEITHYLGVKEDITERKQNDALLLAAKERAENLAKTKSQFLANMSHEIRTPMNAIIGFSELALLKDMPAEVNDYLTNINTASNNLLVILNDILHLSKLEAGQMELNLSPFSVYNLQTTLHNLLINAAQSKGLAFSIDLASNVPEHLIGDSIRLRQVLTNLLGNAIKFTQQGAVNLNISLQQIDDQQARLLFAVTDTGIGISPEQKSKLFLPFSQVDDGYARNFEGTGLGLVISQDLVQLMGSLIEVNSNPGFGSCFSFELLLPIAPLTALTSLKAPSSTISSALRTKTETLNGIKILVAEDDTFNQKIIHQVLKRLGASLIVLAYDGSEALSALEQDDFDVVLMDLHMPNMNGYEATAEIRKLSRHAQLPVIALSASVTDEDRQRCLAAGMNDFIGKPININELLSTLKQCLKHSSKFN